MMILDKTQFNTISQTLKRFYFGAGKMMRFFTLSFLLFTFHFANAQQNATPDRSSIRTAEPIHVQLISIAPSNNDAFIIPDSIPHFDIWSRSQPQRNGDTLVQNITITSYDSGQFVFPELKIMGAKATVHTNSFIIDVQPVNVDSLKDYHDIKDIIEVPPVPQWPYILGIGLIAVLSIVGVYRFIKKTKITKEIKKQFVPVGNPFDNAMQALSELETKISTQKPAIFFTQLIDIYRRYLAESRNWRSLQQTGDELILQAKPILNHELFYQFANTIRLADAAKFAKYNPPKTEWRSSLAIIKDAIETINRGEANRQYMPRQIKS